MLSNLSRSGWESLKALFKETVPEEEAVLGTVVAIHSLGNFLGFNPHLQVLISYGCFYGDGIFRLAPRFETKHIESIVRHKVFKMLFSKGKITEVLVNMHMSWRHSVNGDAGNKLEKSIDEYISTLYPADHDMVQNTGRV